MAARLGRSLTQLTSFATKRCMSTIARDQPNYVIIAYDHKDDGALERRLQAREAHLARSRFFREEGKVIVGGAITDDAGKMVGSCLLTNFESRDEVEEFVQNDPYVIRGVWADYRIESFRTAPGVGIDASN